MTAAQPHEDTKSHQIVHSFEGVNFMVPELHLNKKTWMQICSCAHTRMYVYTYIHLNIHSLALSTEVTCEQWHPKKH